MLLVVFYQCTLAVTSIPVASITAIDSSITAHLSFLSFPATFIHGRFFNSCNDTHTTLTGRITFTIPIPIATTTTITITTPITLVIPPKRVRYLTALLVATTCTLIAARIAHCPCRGLTRRTHVVGKVGGRFVDIKTLNHHIYTLCK